MFVPRNIDVSNDSYCLLAICAPKLMFTFLNKIIFTSHSSTDKSLHFFNLSGIREFKEKRWLVSSHLNLSCKIYQVLPTYLLCCWEERFSTLACVCVFAWGRGEAKLPWFWAWNEPLWAHSSVTHPGNMRLTSQLALPWSSLMLITSRPWWPLFSQACCG